MFAGDKESFTWRPDDIRITGCSCTCYLRNGDTMYQLPSSLIQNDAFVFNIEADFSATMKAGVYSKFYRVTSDTIKKTYDSGELLVVKEDVTSANTNVTVLTEAQITLNKIRDTIANVQTKGIQRIVVGDKTIQYKSIDELLKAEQYYARLVARENADANKKGFSREIRVVVGDL